ncbi:HindVP family restriction endonuclease [Virgibacillus sp. SK37]|uniref:HindVP family restriction endonuclease n=1 Tax=Virgibacillus sp. SK37 TaxID=403957 RepID=UPI0004D0EA3C|nr:HindVP family restriction endonuclease [Virgibacillus sp. SK37]AIF44922.1 type II restriction endonuclease HindVP [Virgibacillus sp. SK37]
MANEESGLFGLKYSNRDFTEEDNWGKNQFNSSFPAALACYMDSKNINPVYLKLGSEDSSLKVYKDYITVRNLFRIPEDKTIDDVYYEFEGLYEPHNELDRSLLRSDLVIKSLTDGEEPPEYYSHHEVKLTAIPDSATYHKDEVQYGSEIVIRTVSIIHLAINIVEIYKHDKLSLERLLNPVTDRITDWTDEYTLLELLPDMIYTLNSILSANLDKQSPLIMNPVWKTKGKTPALEDNCLDMFVWSDFALTRLFIDSINVNRTKIDRYSRALVWLLYLLHQSTFNDRIDSSKIYTMPFHNQTDKAFASNGNKTNPYMRSNELLTPRIKREEIANIVLGGGQKMLSPERRFDAAISASTDIFEEE